MIHIDVLQGMDCHDPETIVLARAVDVYFTLNTVRKTPASHSPTVSWQAPAAGMLPPTDIQNKVNSNSYSLLNDCFLDITCQYLF